MMYGNSYTIVCVTVFVIMNFCLSGWLMNGAAAGQIQKIETLDDLLEASRVAKETREAGHKLGSRFAKTVMGMDIPL